MSRRQISLAAFAIFAAFLVVLYVDYEGAADAPPPAPDFSRPESRFTSNRLKPTPYAGVVEKSFSTPLAEPAPTLAARLNDPSGTITHDLQILNDVLNDWRLNFPRLGNPVGDNAEITTALTGDNPLKQPLIPPNHPAIGPGGELRDRWNTPFRFHALAGDRMEIRSAGPDKKFGTEDDALMTPP